MSKLVKVAAVNEIAPGSGKEVEVEGRSLALFNVAGTFYAIDNACTHVGGPLGEGTLSGDIVECPWHGARFNVKTGAVCGPPAREGVHGYPVKVEGNDIFVELE
jgi:nitrite reductase/ring-hydroxylating ferredoxin subunit